MTRKQKRAVGVAVLVVLTLGYGVFVSASQLSSAKKFALEAPDGPAYWDATFFGLSDEGARAWSRYSDNAKRYDGLEHELVASGDKECLEFRRLSLSEYLERHPQYQRTPEEDAQLDPHLRALIDGSRYGGDDE